MVWVKRNLPEAGLEVQLAPVAELSYLQQHVLDVGHGEGVAACLGVEGAEVYDQPELFRARFGHRETWCGPWGCGGAYEPMLVQGGDFVTHKFCVCRGGSDGGSGGWWAKSVDFKGGYGGWGFEVS